MVSYTYRRKRGLLVVLLFLSIALSLTGQASATALHVIITENGNITYVPAQPFSVNLSGQVTVDNTASQDSVYSISYSIGDTSRTIGVVENGTSDTQNWTGTSNVVRFEEGVSAVSDGNTVRILLNLTNHFDGLTNISITKHFPEECTYYDAYSSTMTKNSSFVDANNTLHAIFVTNQVENDLTLECIPSFSDYQLDLGTQNYTIQTTDTLLEPTFSFLSNSYFSITKTRQTGNNYSMEFIFENRDTFAINMTEVHLWAIRIPTGKFVPDNASELLFDMILNDSLPIVVPNGTYQTEFTFLSDEIPVVMASVRMLQEMNYTFIGRYSFHGQNTSVYVPVVPPSYDSEGGGGGAGAGGAGGSGFIVKDTINKLLINPESIRAEPGEVRKYTFRVTAPETNLDTLTNIKVKSLTNWAWPQTLIIPVLEPGQSTLIEVLVKAPYELKDHDIRLQFIAVKPLADDIKTIKLTVGLPGISGTEIMPDIRIIKNVEMLDETHYNISIIVISLREDNLTDIKIKDDISMLNRIRADPKLFTVAEGTLILTIPLLEAYDTLEFNYYGESPELIDVKKAELVPDDRRLIALSTTGFIRFSTMGMIAGAIRGLSPFWIELSFILALLLLILLLLLGRRRKKKKGEKLPIEHHHAGKLNQHEHEEIEKINIEKLKKDVERLREMRKRFETHDEHHAPPQTKKGRK